MTVAPRASREGPPEVVFRTDLDKTYIQTEFSSVRGMVDAAFERPSRKRTVPGMRALLAALSRQHDSRLVVVSASPEQLRGRLEAMFRLHGIEADRIVLKDWVALLKRGRFGGFRNQVPYKIKAHLDTRLWLIANGGAGPEICFGDDAETDALIYCLYSDICARRVSASRLSDILFHCGGHGDEIEAALGRLAMVPRGDPVQRIFIHLEARTPPRHFGAYRGRVTPTFNALQIALALAEDGVADDPVIVAVIEGLLAQRELDAMALAGTLEDAARRGLVGTERAAHVASEVLPRTVAFDRGFRPALGERVAARIAAIQAWDVAPADPRPLPYERLFEDERRFARARRLARKTAARVPGLVDFLEEP